MQPKCAKFKKLQLVVYCSQGWIQKIQIGGAKEITADHMLPTPSLSFSTNQIKNSAFALKTVDKFFLQYRNKMGRDNHIDTQTESTPGLTKLN